MIGSFYRSRNYLTPEAILYLYKSQIRPKMDYCSHIWAGSPKSTLSVLDRLQNRIRSLVGDQLFSNLQLGHRRDVASLSLLYRYVNGKCSAELKGLVPPLWEFVRNTRYSVSCNNHTYLLRIPLEKKKFHSNSFFHRTASMWNTLPPESFPVIYDLDRFKLNINKCLSK